MSDYHPPVVVLGQIEGSPGTYAKILVKSDGTVKVEGITTISGAVDISDDWTRQLGQVDIARYLGSAMGLTNPLHSQIVVSGGVIDPRSIRALLSSDIVTAYGSQTQALLQRASTYDLIVQLRSAGAEIDPRDIRWLTTYDEITPIGGLGYALQQRAATYDLLVQLRSGGTEIDPRSIRALAKATDEIYSVLRTDAGAAYDARDRSWNLGASDVPDLSDRAARLLGKTYGSQGQVLLQRASTYESVVQLSHQGSEYDSRQIRALTSADVVDVVDKAARLLGVIYGSQGQKLLQTPTNYNTQVELTTGATLYDARQVRALLSSDVVTAYGSQTQALLQRASTYDLIVQLRSAGTEIDPRSMRALLSTDVITAYGSQTQALLQRASTYDLQVQLRTAGTEYDARQIRTLTSSDVVTPQNLSETGYASLGSTQNYLSVGVQKPLIVVTFPYVFDGSNWVRLLGDSTGLKVQQATRTSLLVQAERTDLTGFGGTYSPNVGGVQVVAGSANKYVKVYNAGYEILAAGVHFFYFGTSTTAPSLPSAKVFMAGSAIGKMRNNYGNIPMNTGSAGDGLYIYSAVSETSMPVDVQFAQE